MRKVIAIDFDGCLCEDLCPDIGAPCWPVINRAKQRQKDGWALVLWTCRIGEQLEAAIAACAEWGLSFDAVNENLPEWREAYGNDTRKIGATEYWDDKAVVMPVTACTSANAGAALLKQAEILSIERRPEACLGCGFEHSCSTHGCAVIKGLIELAKAEKDNGPLTLEELREMDGEPVWVQSDIFPEDCGYRVIQRAEILFVDFTDGRRLSLTDYDKSWLAYYRKPEGGKDNA